MKPIGQRLATGLQWTGLVMAVLGLVTTPLFGMGFSVQWIGAGAVAVALDVIAVRTESETKAMLAALLKLIVLLVALFVLKSTTSTPTPDGSIPAETGPILLLLGVLPSQLGAMLRRSGTQPMPEMGVPPELQR